MGQYNSNRLRGYSDLTGSNSYVIPFYVKNDVKYDYYFIYNPKRTSKYVRRESRSDLSNIDFNLLCINAIKIFTKF